MAIKSSGTFLKFSEIAAEFQDTQPYSLSEYIRGESLVPEASSNSNIRSRSQRDAGGTNGRMKFSDYYGSQRILAEIIAANAENLDLETLFGTTAWQSNTPKQVTINSSVIVGATSTSGHALTVSSGMGGTLEIINNGSIQGAGGAAGAAGGNAIRALSAVTITNNGDIYAGGGGGGNGGTGGTGGQGRYGSSSSYTGSCGAYCTCGSGGSGSGCVTGCYYGPRTDRQRGRRYSSCTITTYYYTSGGSGGAGGGGGVGQGYNQTLTAGSSGSGGSGGGTNAGTGGTGGTGGSGGDWGASGANGNTGNTGYNGNWSNGSGGSGGSSGASGGYYINGISNVTLVNNGNTAGGTV